MADSTETEVESDLSTTSLRDDHFSDWLARRKRKRDGVPEPVVEPEPEVEPEHEVDPEHVLEVPTLTPRTVEPAPELLDAPEPSLFDDSTSEELEAITLDGDAMPAPRLRMWVVQGDPAIDHPDVVEAVVQLSQSYEILVLGDDDGAAWLTLPSDTRRVPDVLVFGDLHALLGNPVVEALAHDPRVRRVLLSTHRNSDLYTAATEFCHVDEHLVLPECAPRLAAHLSLATSPPHHGS